MTKMQSGKSKLNALRRKAKRHDIQIVKSRQGQHLEDRGGLMLVDVYRNAVIAGANFDLDLDTAAHWVDYFALQVE